MKEIKKIAIAGSGIMGVGMAQCFAQKGYDVLVYDINQELLDKCIDSIKFNQKTLIEYSIISEECAVESLDRISLTTNLGDFADADFVIEAIIENLEIKQDFWKKVEEICDGEAIFATNTSGLSINDVCAKLDNKSRFAGTNWWNPPHIIPLVEVTMGDDTSEETVQSICDTLKEIGKEPVVIRKEINGFIGNRIQFAVFREALNIAAQGIASYEDIDRAVKYGIGFRYPTLGPFETADLGGLDTFYYISKNLFKDLSSSEIPPEILEEIFNEKKYGIKTGEGFFKYESEEQINTILKERDEKFLKTLKALA
ncbi:3-hydroxyacyl-CoA dehydrogenase family protein [Wukongibacter baidiensis]|uniref:3-hydroxyacyl-CoA dehydrogenase family protein n=1 Tax=Wukongibacter baidiensis TaxID=1723361 RepID=UPI003D7FA2BE